MGLFGEFLVRRGQLSPDGLKKAMDLQQMAGGRLGTNILEAGLAEEQELLRALGEFRRTPTVSAAQLLQVSVDVLRLVPPQIARRHLFVPIERHGNTLTLAARDPLDPLVEDELGYLTSCLVKTKIGLELRIHEALEQYYQVDRPVRLSGLTRRLDRPRPERPRPPAPPPPAGEPSASPPPAPPVARRPAPVDPPPLRSEPKADLETEITYVELDSEEVARIYEADSQERTPEERLAQAAEELQGLSIRDEIADVMLGYARPYLGRRLLLVRRKDRIVGWRGEGEGVDVEKVRAIDLDASEPSVFLTLSQGTKFWLGSLASMPTHRSVIDALGGSPPKDCLIVPVILRSRRVCFLYGDNREESVAGAPLAELRRLAAKAGVAFEVSILKNKIRTL